MTPPVSLKVTGVTVEYPGPRTRDPALRAVRDVTMSLVPGEIVGLAGANGAGKTSLLEVCIGALTPSSGQVSWFDETKLTRRVSRRIGFCPDVPSFPHHLSGREVLRLFAGLDGLSRREADRRIDELIAAFQLEDALHRRVETLSRGTVQRLGVMQALLSPRDLLVCDETFAPLDPVAQISLRGILKGIADRGATVLVSSHQLDQLARVSDRVAIMREGELVAWLDARALARRRLARLRTSVRAPDRLADALLEFPSAWVVDDSLFIPWEGDEPAAEDIAGRFPSLGPPFMLEEYADLSLESAFMATQMRT